MRKIYLKDTHMECSNSCVQAICWCFQRPTRHPQQSVPFDTVVAEVVTGALKH